MKRHPVSGIYAEALLQVAEEQGKADDIEAEFRAVAELLTGARELKIFFESPKIKAQEKVEVLERVLAGKASEPVLNLLKLLIGRGRQTLLTEISASLSEKLDDLRGRAHVVVTTAVPLDEGVRTQLISLVEKKLGRTVISQERVDENLLGGMTIRIGDTVIDGSVRTKLNKVREALAAPRIGSELFE